MLDESSNPITGVTVQLKNGSTSTTTNATGNFSISVPDRNAVLVFSYVGYENFEAVAGRDNLLIHLKARNNALEDWVRHTKKGERNRWYG